MIMNEVMGVHPIVVIKQRRLVLNDIFLNLKNAVET